MTPLQFASTECSNYAHNGSCKGIGINNDCTLQMFGTKPKCVLGTQGVRCAFFEECVMPLALRIETTNANQLKRRKEYEEASRTYRLYANIPQSAKRSCPKCGRELEPKKRLCYVCAYATQEKPQKDENTEIS